VVVDVGSAHVIHGEGDIVLQFQRLALMTFSQDRKYIGDVDAVARK